MAPECEYSLREGSHSSRVNDSRSTAAMRSAPSGAGPPPRVPRAPPSGIGAPPPAARIRSPMRRATETASIVGEA
eukprot:scaffold23668_cov101-Isochrysis_galbana.AAC.1